MEGGQLAAARVSPQFEDGVEEDHDGERDQDLVDQNCADSLAEFHRVHLPQGREEGDARGREKEAFSFQKLGSTVTCSQEALVQSGW